MLLFVVLGLGVVVGSGGFVCIKVCKFPSLLVGHLRVVWAICRASFSGLYRSIFALGGHHILRSSVRVFSAGCFCVLCVSLCFLDIIVVQVAFSALWHMVMVSAPLCGGGSSVLVAGVCAW